MAMRVLLTICVLVFGILLPVLEVNATHVFNPQWPAHARLHEVWQLCTHCLLAALCIVLAWREKQLRLAAVIALCVTGGFLLAYAMRSGYGGSMLNTDGKEKIVGGINVSAIAVLVMAVVSVLLGAILALTKKADPSTSPAITPSSSCGEEKP